MKATIENAGSTTPRRRTRLARAAVIVVSAAVVGVLVTACHSGNNSPSVATLSSSPTSTSRSASSGPTGGAGDGVGNGQGGQQIGGAGGGITVAYSQCMRSHGVPRFPDPDSQGKVTIPAGSGIDQQSSIYQAAQRACQKYLSGAAPNPSQSAQARANALKFSQCMRSHGITNFPDPDAQGRIGINSNSGIDQQSAAFQAAQKACSPLMGNPGSGS